MRAFSSLDEHRRCALRREAPRMRPGNSYGETRYEKNQRFNPLVSWLHSVRYKNILSLFGTLAHDAADRRLKVVDIGCAHAKLFQVLNNRFDVDYTGIEVDADLVEAARSRFASHPNFRIVHDSVLNALPSLESADVLVAMETCEHIPEHEVVRIIEAIAGARPRFFVCSVPVEVGPTVWLKNVGSLLTGYIRHREYRCPRRSGLGYISWIAYLRTIPDTDRRIFGFTRSARPCTSWAAQYCCHCYCVAHVAHGHTMIDWLPDTSYLLRSRKSIDLCSDTITALFS